MFHNLNLSHARSNYLIYHVWVKIKYLFFFFRWNGLILIFPSVFTLSFWDTENANTWFFCQTRCYIYRCHYTVETAHKNNNLTSSRSPYSISCYFKMALNFYSDGMKDDTRLALARWGLKNRCRRITISAAAISHNQCQCWWTSMRVGWRLTFYHGRKKGKSESVFTGCVNNKKIPYLKAAWLWARSLGQLCNRE